MTMRLKKLDMLPYLLIQRSFEIRGGPKKEGRIKFPKKCCDDKKINVKKETQIYTENTYKIPMLKKMFLQLSEITTIIVIH